MIHMLYFVYHIVLGNIFLVEVLQIRNGGSVGIEQQVTNYNYQSLHCLENPQIWFIECDISLTLSVKLGY
jgi:hypothetical protein